MTQNFEKIQHECLSRNSLWEDPDFPASQQSLFRNSKKDPLKDYTVTWMRPPDIVQTQRIGKTAALFADYEGLRFSLIQGYVGDCWLVASLASLASESQRHLSRVIPFNQSFDEKQDYCGIFRVNFWRFGRWVEVLVDDRLPTINNAQLIFIKSCHDNEFWGSIVEKAYAKLNGSYEALTAGLMADAMDDLTGGITETVVFSMPETVPKHLKSLLKKTIDRLAIIGTAIYATGPENEGTTTLSNGLVSGHAYSLTNVEEYTLGISAQRVYLLRIRNPWGNKVEWTGAWSDKSTKWHLLTQDQLNLINREEADDGEFWMDYEDYVTNFSALHMCHMQEDHSEDEKHDKDHWTVTQYKGQWVIGQSAGGRPFYRDSFWKNPQYRFSVKTTSAPKTTVLIGVQQRDLRRKFGPDATYLSIGFVVYKLNENARNMVGPMSQLWFQNNQFLETVYFFTPARSNVRSFEMLPGEYMVVPCTYKPEQAGDFLLRIFIEGCSESASKSQPVKPQNPLVTQPGSKTGSKKSSCFS